MKFPKILFFASAIILASCSTNTVQEEETLYVTENTPEVAAVTVALSAMETELFDLVNVHRESQGLNALTFSEEIYQYAVEHNELMESEGEISHKNFNQRATKVADATNATKIGENVAKDFDNVNDALTAWLQSQSHKNTLEGDYTHTAISIKENDEGEYYYTQIFFKE